MQIKSKQRVADHGEVYTHEREVNAMLDLVADQAANPETTFLEPACGNGNFLAEILRRKLQTAAQKHKKIQHDYERTALLAVGSIYGIELLPDNVVECVSRLHQIFAAHYQAAFPKTAKAEILNVAYYILSQNILCGDTLKLQTANGEPIVFAEWKAVNGSKIKRRDYVYSDLVNKTSERELPLFSDLGEGGKCKDCGASQEVYDRDNDELENHAYAFIHGDWAQQILETDNMKFDVIIGNPPYQLSDGGAQASAKPIYHEFIRQAKKLNPDYLVMITPSRWFAGGKGLDEFRDEMINDRRIKEIHDFPNAADCFPCVEIKGGVSYFLWDKRKQDADCLINTYESGNLISQMTRPLKEQGIEVFVRYNEAIGILRKVKAKQEKSFNTIISSAKPFGLRTFVKGNPNPYTNEQNVLLYQNGGTGYIKREIIQVNTIWIDKHKIYIGCAYGAGEGFPHQILNKPIYGSPNSCCTETYLLVGEFVDKAECENVMSYMATRFFRFMVLLKKNTQDAPKRVYEFVPMQDFSKSWTDTELYAKYGLTDEEIAFIEKMVRPMELEND